MTAPPPPAGVGDGQPPEPGAAREAGLDRARKYLVPVAKVPLPEHPDLVHLSVYEWLPQFEAWATGIALCGYSTRQGALPADTEITCGECLKYKPGYEDALDVHAQAARPPDDERFARVFNAISDALRMADRWVPLSARRAATAAALAAMGPAADAPAAPAEPTTCTATIDSFGLHRCAQPAGHYDETREPDFYADPPDPGGYHQSSPEYDGGPVTWNDRADNATPHTPKDPA